MEEQLKELLESVPNSYDDFVEGIMLYCDTDELRESMINFIDRNEGVFYISDSTFRTGCQAAASANKFFVSWLGRVHPVS